ncbi:branched-chain amino acid ABC transporter permease [Isoptericola halotolerans]|uniref:Branched-chain amino acid transport system permease protein n=1 Tax=Isoptericola halotolerans TaxID=300560 RepID=A0ABX2A654_9MICO|nr:branched-chain amino acid ABC transporter permease [Isoptericola halotolerans]NOV98303.1 branched-chain amino acid transport system permease protein [Isoptericola halotolerans]
MDRLAFLLATGLARGLVIALFALSLVIIWRAARIVNFAQAAMATVAVYVAYAVVTWTGSYWLALVAAVVTGMLVGFAVERWLIRRVPRDNPLPGMIVAIGLVMILHSVIGILFGPRHVPMRAPFSREPLYVGDVAVLSPYDLFVLLLALGIVVALAVLFNRTTLGLQLRAAATAPEVSRLLGIRVPRMVTIGWMLSSAVAAVAVLLLIPTELGLNAHSADILFVHAFTVAVLGGLDSPVGAIVGGVAVGVLITLVTGFLGAGMAPIAVLALLTLVLLVRPGGIFAVKEARAA